MIKHSDILHKDDWDALIILDACRYDTFKKLYKDYIPDDLIYKPLVKANSEASQTIYWLYKHWPNFYDILYISGNPYINSTDTVVSKYKGNQHFRKVVDSWDWGYSKKTSRIEPNRIAKDALKWEKTLQEKSQMIVHFMQPHSPYLFKDKKFKWYEMLRNRVPVNLLPKRLKTWIGKNYKREDVYSRLDCENDVILEAYERNLRSVFPYVTDLAMCWKGKKVIVTSDHGEYLGEDGRFGHWGEINDFITSVPYMVLRYD